jgi:hypothetical protein
VSGRRTKWLTVVAWIVLLVALSPLSRKLADETNDETQSFLPDSAESTEVVRLLDEEFEGGQTVNGLLIYERPGGLTPADRLKIRRDAEKVADVAPLSTPPSRPVFSSDRDLAITTLTVPDNNDKLGEWGSDVKDAVGEGSGGLRIYLSGDLGFNADAEEVFGSIDTRLLLATTLLVLVLLGAIYRSPVIAVIPLIVVGVAVHVRPGFHLSLRAERRGGVEQRDEHPRRPHVRGGHRLLPAARLSLPRGAPAQGGQARGDGASGATGRARDPRERSDGLARDAGAACTRWGPCRRLAWRSPSAPGSHCCRHCSRSPGGAASGPADG